MQLKLSNLLNDSFANDQVFTTTISENATKTKKIAESKPSILRRIISCETESFINHFRTKQSRQNSILYYTQSSTCTYFMFYIDTNFNGKKMGSSRRNGRITRRNICARWYCNWTQLFSSAKQLSYRLVVGKAERFSF